MCYRVNDIRNKTELERALIPVVTPKALGTGFRYARVVKNCLSVGYEQLMARLIVEAALDILPGNPAEINLDNFRVAKLVGGGVQKSYVIHGMAMTRDTTSKAAAGRCVRRRHALQALQRASRIARF